jgi:hypothetical protein
MYPNRALDIVMTDFTAGPMSAADQLKAALVAIARDDAHSAESIVVALDALGGFLEPRAARALHLASLAISGEANERAGRPQKADAKTLARIAAADDESKAIRAEARRLVREEGGAFDSHRRRLERKLKKVGQNL